MSSYIIKISYDGSKFAGLQKLKNDKTVQGEIEDALKKLEGKYVKLYSAGRTDKGVHAINQVCTFTISKDIDPYRLRYYIDRATSKYIYIKTCDYLDDPNFHPRFSAISKTYKYLINTGAYDPIKEDYVYNYKKPLDIKKMKSAAKQFLGDHNYRAFVVGPQKTCESNIKKITIEEKYNIITITISGKAFYTYMVRNIVRILILIGANKIDEKIIDEMLQKGKKQIEYSPAPPSGLYLEDIEY